MKALPVVDLENRWFFGEGKSVADGLPAPIRGVTFPLEGCGGLAGQCVQDTCCVIANHPLHLHYFG